MRGFCLACLKFLNLTDSSQRLSITNITVIVLVVKIAIDPVIDWPVAAGLLASLLSYSHKRKVTAEAAEKDKDCGRISELQQEVNALVLKTEEFKKDINMLAESNAALAQVKDEAQKLISQMNLMSIRR